MSTVLAVARGNGELGPGHLQGGGAAGGPGKVVVLHQGVRRSHCWTRAGSQLVWKPGHHGESLSIWQVASLSSEKIVSLMDTSCGWGLVHVVVFLLRITFPFLVVIVRSSFCLGFPSSN